MKLQKIHLFLFILLAIIASSFGFAVKEYMTNRVSLGDEGLDMEEEGESVWQHRRGNGNHSIIIPMRGIRKEQIPEGDEDLYILKSKIVPPVCPKCPDNRSCPREKKCPPCKPCGRCPEPAFECKKVPSNKNVNPGLFDRKQTLYGNAGSKPGSNNNSNNVNSSVSKNASSAPNNAYGGSADYDQGEQGQPSLNQGAQLPKPLLNSFSQF